MRHFLLYALLLGLCYGQTKVKGQQVVITGSGSIFVFVANSVIVTPRTVGAPVGGTVSFSAVSTDNSGNTTPACTASGWSSSSPGFATINASTGVATAVAPGTTTISCTASGIIGNATLVVESSPSFTNPVTPCTQPCPLFNGVLNQSYSNTLTASGATPPYIFSFISGTIPPGLGLSSSGLISGFPTSAGNFVFTVQVCDSLSACTSLQVSILVSGGCGPPTYTCSSRSSAVIQTPNTPPFSGTTGYNTTAYDTSINTNAALYLRATDNTQLSGQSPSSTPSGGDNDSSFNCAGRHDTSAACQNATTYFLDVQFGGCDFVMGIQRSPAFQVVAPLPSTTGGSNHPSPCGAFSWSHQDPAAVYWEGATNGDPTIYKAMYSWDGVPGHTLTFSSAPFVDIGASCPLPNGIAYAEKWSGPLSLDINDQKFVFASSNLTGIPSSTGATGQVGNGASIVTITATTLGSATVNSAGSGYTVGTLIKPTQGGSSGGTMIVTSVNGGGGITGLSVSGMGHGYSTATNLPTTIVSGSGSGATVNITTGLITDGSFVNAIVRLNGVAYTVQSNTLTTITLTTPFSGSACSTSCTFTVASGQGTGFYIVNYNTTGPYCVVLNTFSGSTSCMGTGCPATGTLDNGCHNMYLHDGFSFRDGVYGQWSGANTGINCGHTSLFWQAGTTHAVACTGLTTVGNSICGGHNTFGWHNERAINNPSFYEFDPGNANSAVPFPPFGAMNGNCENHFSWQNATSAQTEAIIGASSNVNYQTSSTTTSWGFPGQNEVYALFGNGTLVRFGHTFVLGLTKGGASCGQPFIGPASAYFTAQNAIGVVSQDGTLWEYSSDMLGNLGIDAAGATRADIFIISLD